MEENLYLRKVSRMHSQTRRQSPSFLKYIGFSLHFSGEIELNYIYLQFSQNSRKLFCYNNVTDHDVNIATKPCEKSEIIYKKKVELASYLSLLSYFSWIRFESQHLEKRQI